MRSPRSDPEASMESDGHDATQPMRKPARACQLVVPFWVK
jgi:hypothetical protein